MLFLNVIFFFNLRVKKKIPDNFFLNLIFGLLYNNNFFFCNFSFKFFEKDQILSLNYNQIKYQNQILFLNYIYLKKLIN